MYIIIFHLQGIPGKTPICSLVSGKGVVVCLVAISGTVAMEKAEVVGVFDSTSKCFYKISFRILHFIALSIAFIAHRICHANKRNCLNL